MTVAARASSLEPQPLEVHLVPMRRRHLRSILRIEAQVYSRPWSLSLFLSELALRTSRHYLVARVDGVVVGYAGLMFSGDDAHVTNIAVDPIWHRSKIASRLLLELTKTALERKALNLTLEVRVTNTGAQALYQRFGFFSAGVRKNYYVETSEDALVMWAEHIDEPEFQQRLADIEASIPGSTVVGEELST